jgi:uncharacterized protein (PEP-CTERM system associated)
MRKTVLASFFALAFTAQAQTTNKDVTGWVFSPTIETRLHQVSLDSNVNKLNRDDTVASVFMDNALTYQGNRVSGQLYHQMTAYEYSDTQESNLIYHDFRGQIQAELWRDDLTAQITGARFYEVLNTIQGSFIDELYSEENQVVRTQQQHSVRYDFPHTTRIEGTINALYGKEKIDLNGDQETNRRIDPEGISTTSAFVNIRPRFVTRGFWEFQGNANRQSRRFQENVQFYTASGGLRIPVVNRYFLSLYSQYERFQNPNGWRYSEGGDALNNQVSRIGAGWAKNHLHSYLQVTYDWDHEEEQGDIGLDFSWRFDERWSIRLQDFRRFYGDSYNASFVYQGLRNRWLFSYSEDVQIRYFLTADQNVEGLYICQPDGDGELRYDDTLCFLPPEGEFQLGPNQAIIPNIELTFPLESRLTLNSIYRLDWEYSTEDWSHRFTFFSRDSEDLEFDFKEMREEGLFEGQWNINSVSYLRFGWQYRNLRLFPQNVYGGEALYSFGYHREINRQSEWSITLQHINKNASNTGRDIFSYDNNSLILSYRHFFGEKHKDRRELFPKRNAGLRPNAGIQRQR